MAEIFLGDLSHVRLFDVLKPLLLGKKTGILSIKGMDTGEAYLETGNITHARAGQVTGEEAFNLLMGWRTGKCTFESEVVSPDKTIPISTEQLLMNWSYRKQEMEKIRNVIPSMSAVFRFSSQAGAKDMSFKADQLKVIALINGMRTIAEVAETLKWDEIRTARVIYQLVQGGILEREEEPGSVGKKVVSENFFSTLEMEMKKIMGPVAPIIVEDKLGEMGLVKEYFPRDKAGIFVEALGQEIPQDTKRKEFLRVMEEFLIRER